MGAKQFREDLFYRLSAVTLLLPPLRDRAEDIPALAKYFLRRHCLDLGVAAPAIQPEGLHFLQSQPWPGNVRELENVIRQALLVARDYPVSLDHLQRILSKSKRPVPTADQTIAAYLDDLLNRAQRGEAADVQARMAEEMERELYHRAIRLAQGNQTKAAHLIRGQTITFT